jgi:hypothetical protein
MTPYAACAAVSSASAVPATVPPAVNVTLTVFFISSVPHTTPMSLYGMPVGPNVTPVVNACSSARSRNVKAPCRPMNSAPNSLVSTSWR